MLQIHRVGESVVRSRRTASAISTLSRSPRPKLHPARIYIRRCRIRHEQTSRPQGGRRRTKVSRRLSEGWRSRGFPCWKVVVGQPAGIPKIPLVYNSAVIVLSASPFNSHKTDSYNMNTTFIDKISLSRKFTASFRLVVSDTQKIQPEV